LACIERYALPKEDFARALVASVERYAPASRGSDLKQFILNLRLQDLALATACACGIQDAWEEFHRSYRQFLVEVTGESDLADHIIGELYGVEGTPGQMANFRGRSSLKTWLRAIAFQAQVDRHRRESRLVELDALPVEMGRNEHPEDFERRENAAALARALAAEVKQLPSEERLLLAWYYVDGLRLAEIARLRQVHESTMSRELDAIRKRLRKRVENGLRSEGFSAARIADCFRHSTEATLDIEQLLESKKSNLNRTGVGEPSGLA